MAEVFKVTVHIPPSIVGLIRRLSVAEQHNMIAKMGRDVACRFGGHFMDASRTRHKTANKYGVRPTGILEFSRDYPPRNSRGGEITSRNEGSAAVLTIKGIPFLSRAFGEVTIVPKAASALTIPISRFSVHKRAGELKREGWSLFTLGNRGHVAGVSRRRNGILFGSLHGGDIVPLYALVKRVTLPQDAGLMPSENIIGSWAASSAKEYLGL